MIKVAKFSEIPEGGSKLVMVNDIPIALFNIKGIVFAWDNRCPHRGASLADGNISEKIIQCKFHLWDFNVETACAAANPNIKIKSFPAEIQDGAIFIVD